MSDFVCDCHPKTLLDSGCQCGFFKREKRDKEIIAKREADEARVRLAGDAAWFTGPMPVAPAINDSCGTCGHPSSMHTATSWSSAVHNACIDVNCACMEWKHRV